MKAKDLQVGDWFVVKDSVWYENTQFYIVDIKENMYWINSPTFLNNSEPDIVSDTQLNYCGFTLIGKSTKNPWYKWFGWTKLVHPFKMIPL